MAFHKYKMPKEILNISLPGITMLEMFVNEHEVVVVNVMSISQQQKGWKKGEECRCPTIIAAITADTDLSAQAKG